jgi:hypothetical protein
MAKQYFVTVQEVIQKGKRNLLIIPRVILYMGAAWKCLYPTFSGMGKTVFPAHDCDCAF